MLAIKKQITDLFWKHATKAHGAGSCGELGDSFMAIDSDSFSDLADELIKALQNHIDKTVGLYAFDIELDNIFENLQTKESCKTCVEAYLVQQI